LSQKKKDIVDLVRNNMINETNNEAIANAANCMIDSTQDFTDSMYIGNEQRERVLNLSNEIKQHIDLLLNNDETPNDSMNNNNKPDFSRLFKLSPLLGSCETLKKTVSSILYACTQLLCMVDWVLSISHLKLQTQALSTANHIFSENKDASLLVLIKSASNSGQYDVLLETLDKFKDYSDQVQEVGFAKYKKITFLIRLIACTSKTNEVFYFMTNFQQNRKKEFYRSFFKFFFG
jgi:hypothetical protein